jgi:hypothetical protein
MVAEMVNVKELLPFYVNGSLTAEERARVERGLSEDSLLRDDALALTRLRAAMQSQEPERSPGPFGRARLMRDIDRQDSAGVVETGQGGPMRRRTSPFPSVLAAAVVAGLFALGVGWFSQSDTAPYRLASGGDVATVQGPVLTIAFRPDATEAQIATLLRELRLGIVAGPTSIGLYRVEAGPSADLTELAVRLRAVPEVIESVGLP